MPLDKLSSGEKQIISIFSRLYLEDSSPVAILFDEPELSLSMEWQRKLLQDIVDSDKCIFLLAATHSPFIFDNDLDQFASLLDIRYREDEHESN
jgi:predicted ATP-binding protein involved in virulence